MEIVMTDRLEKVTRVAFTAAMMSATLMLAGCSQNRIAGTGDVAFRLIWDGSSDLDLYVVEPTGGCMFWGDRSVASGGLLDVDCNAEAERMCERPIKNVFWPVTAAPAGDYLFWVDVRTLIPSEQPLAFELQLLHGQRVVWRREGSAGLKGQIIGPYVHRYPLELSAMLSSFGDSAPDCRLKAPPPPSQ
jgi:hypothetical protein